MKIVFIKHYVFVSLPILDVFFHSIGCIVLFKSGGQQYFKLKMFCHAVEIKTVTCIVKIDTTLTKTGRVSPPYYSLNPIIISAE